VRPDGSGAPGRQSNKRGPLQKRWFAGDLAEFSLFVERFPLALISTIRSDDRSSYLLYGVWR
jgi:hypothetical protein